MPERSVVQSTFTIERTYDWPPKRVFAAWADPGLKSRWFGGGTDEKPMDLDTDFRVGGHECDRSEPGAYEARFHDIVPDEHIVVRSPDVLIVEGLNVLQPPSARYDGIVGVAVNDYFDFSVYVDAETEDVERWYVERFLRLRETAFAHPDSFFHRFAELSDAQADAVIEAVRAVAGSIS